MILETIAILAGLGIIVYGLHKTGTVDFNSVLGNQSLGDGFGFDGYDFEQNLDGEARFPAYSLNISRAGIDFIKLKEGFVATPYKDPAGVWTIGYGTTKGINGNTGSITRAQGEALMLKDIADFHTELSSLVKVTLKQGEYDALMSFIYNLGAANLGKSTLLKKLNAGDYAGAANELPRWNKARVNGQLTALNGLTIRRNEERAMFLA